MKEINLKLKTKVVNCEVSSIKCDIMVEEPNIDIVIPKKILQNLIYFFNEFYKNNTI